MPSRFPSLIGFLLCLASLAPSPAGGEEANKRLELYHGLAQGNYLTGDLGGAERGIEQMLRLDPDYSPALTLKAQILLDRDRSAEALALLERLTERHPEDLSLLNRKALALGRLGHRSEALALLERVVAQSGDQREIRRMALHLTGLLRMAGEEWDAAAQAFRRADSDTSADPMSLSLAGEAYLEKADRALRARKVAEAIEAIDQAIAVYEEESGETAFNEVNRLRALRAQANAQSGNFEAAIDDLRHVTARQPDDLAARITLASLYAAAGRFESLRGLLDPIAGLPELADIYHYFEGRLAFAEDRVGTARQHFEKALEAIHGTNPGLSANLHFYRALCLQRLQRPDEAAVALNAAIESEFRPETAEEAVAAAGMLLRQERADHAVPILEAVTLNRIDESAEAWALLGRAHQSRGETALALSALSESLRIDREQPETLALRGSMLRHLGDIRGAAADFESALALNPEAAAIHYGLGLCQLRAGAIPRAARAFSRAAELDPNNASLQLFHGLLAFDLEQYEAARRATEQYEALVLENRNPTVYYLNYLLEGELPASTGANPAFELFVDYCEGTATRKEVLDHAGRAETARAAKRQICEAAFWMAQYERREGSATTARELFRIVAALDLPDEAFFQIARRHRANP